MNVNFEKATIIWLVNGEQVCHAQTPIIQEGRDWRPYIFMRDKGDSIDWIES